MDYKFSVTVDLFSTDVEVYITDEIHTTCEKIDKENNDVRNKTADMVSGFEDALSLYVNQYKGGMIYKRYIILLDPEACDNEIIHECLHTAWYILDHKQIECDARNHEVLAYLQGFLYERVKSKLLKYQSKH